MKSELLKFCHYYKGEADIPLSLDDLEIGYWIAEATAVNAVEEDRTGRMLAPYYEAGEPGKNSKLPPILLSTLFFHYIKGSEYSPEENIKTFEEVYLPRYIASTSM